MLKLWDNYMIMALECAIEAKAKGDDVAHKHWMAIRELIYKRTSLKDLGGTHG